MTSKFTYSGVPTHDDGHQSTSSNGNGAHRPQRPQSSAQHAPHHHHHQQQHHKILPKLALCLLAIAVVAAARHVLVSGRPGSDSVASSAPCPPLPAAAGHHPSPKYSSPTDDPGGPTAPWPRVAWVMSFPNSGTSYTMRLIQRMSNQTGASNYGKECDVDTEGNNFPVHEWSKEGPFYSQPFKRKLPTRYVVTKTHCGGYTTDSGPEKYVHTSRSFMMQCLTGNKIAPTFDEDGNVVRARGVPLSELEKLHTRYDASIVQRAVHVVRDPFDNVVSRFHLEQHVHTKQKKEEWLGRYPSTPEGFQRWCKDMDEAHAKEESDSRFMDDELLNAFEGVPCHSEFFRYVQWHNLALSTTRKMRLPTLVLNYETFESDFDRTYDELFSFLELPRDGSMTDFVAGKKYVDYFSNDQKKWAMKLVRLLTEPDTWEIIRRYNVY